MDDFASVMVTKSVLRFYIMAFGTAGVQNAFSTQCLQPMMSLSECDHILSLETSVVTSR